MDKIERYRQIIQQVLNYHSQFKPLVGETEQFVSFDRDRDRYHLFTVGWNQHQRIYGCLIHIDIRDGKLWIQYDGTEDGVLAFQSAYMRHYTDFAVS